MFAHKFEGSLGIAGFDFRQPVFLPTNLPWLILDYSLQWV
jgi:hypothetical protein